MWFKLNNKFGDRQSEEGKLKVNPRKTSESMMEQVSKYNDETQPIHEEVTEEENISPQFHKEAKIPMNSKTQSEYVP